MFNIEHKLEVSTVVKTQQKEDVPL